ncbi:hypothetical protein CspeluHIS016_0405150 [Cutaneotrichosporon spelunceum]|uniref:Uncharacterized protein n=1 Tax=Cutaneotrichosporon spelunceum TaxID=1672016 RepID=A0AAD3YC46_9TREE|nr:hypothetical protein CspeluHIS016_0405150 [Cutaneotrichosporon spelunceum]
MEPLTLFPMPMAMSTIHCPDSPVSPARSSRMLRSPIKRSQPLPQHHAHRKTSAFTRRQHNASGTRRQHNASGTRRQLNASGTRRQFNASGTRRCNNVSGTYSRHGNISGPPPLSIHTHIPHPRTRHSSLIKPFLVRAPRTPPSSPLLTRTPRLQPPPRPWTPLLITDDAASFVSSRPCSPALVNANPKSQRRKLRHAVRSLLSNIMRRQREDIEEDENEEASLRGLTGGAPLRPHRSPGAESFHATSGRVALEPTRSSSPPVRMSVMAVPDHDSPTIRPQLILRPRTRRLHDRLESRFSDSSEDSEGDDVSIFSLGKHAKQMAPLMRRRKWSSAPSLSRGPLRALSVSHGRQGKSLDL